jgi:hypothetical protein
MKKLRSGSSGSRGRACDLRKSIMCPAASEAEGKLSFGFLKD